MVPSVVLPSFFLSSVLPSSVIWIVVHFIYPLTSEQWIVSFVGHYANSSVNICRYFCVDVYVVDLLRIVEIVVSLLEGNVHSFSFPPPMHVSTACFPHPSPAARNGNV